jgi:hypothetical protein
MPLATLRVISAVVPLVVAAGRVSSMRQESSAIPSSRLPPRTFLAFHRLRRLFGTDRGYSLSID